MQLAVGLCQRSHQTHVQKAIEGLKSKKAEREAFTQADVLSIAADAAFQAVVSGGLHLLHSAHHFLKPVPAENMGGVTGWISSHGQDQRA